jgi:hypothetical protein
MDVTLSALKEKQIITHMIHKFKVTMHFITANFMIKCVQFDKLKA